MIFNLFICGLFFVLGILSWPILREYQWVENCKNYFKSLGLFKGEKVSQEEVRRKLFFHDLMNQIHGLTLFFSHKSQSKKNISQEEAAAALREVDMMQSLLVNYFHLKHKNSRNYSSIISFDEIKSDIFYLLERYFPDQKFDITFQGLLAEACNDKNKCKVNRVSFFRIFTNIIKNIQEKNSSKMTFNFDYQEEGLTLTVKNSIEEKKNEDLFFVEKFPWQKQKESGMGLVSITFLAEELGGYSRYFVDNSWWTTQVFFPNPNKLLEAKVFTEENKVA